MNNRSMLIIVMGLVIVMLVSSVVAYEISLVKPSGPSPSTTPLPTATPDASASIGPQSTPTSAPTPTAASGPLSKVLWQKPLRTSQLLWRLIKEKCSS